MNPGGYTVEVTGLSPKATEKDVLDFFAFSGAIELVEIVSYWCKDFWFRENRSGEDACTAYVTFKDAYSQETACLLSGATIVDQRVCITRWGHFDDEFGFWSRPSGHHEEDNTASAQRSQFISSAGSAVTMAQEVVKTMLAMGYVLGKDTLTKAKAFDESHQVSATAAAKVADLSHRIGLTDMIGAGFEAVKTVDEKYHVLQTTKSAISATGRTAAAAADTVVRSSYFSRGALFMSDALNRAAKVAADLGSRGLEH